MNQTTGRTIADISYDLGVLQTMFDAMCATPKSYELEKEIRKARVIIKEQIDKKREELVALIY